MGRPKFFGETVARWAGLCILVVGLFFLLRTSGPSSGEPQPHITPSPVPVATALATDEPTAQQEDMEAAIIFGDTTGTNGPEDEISSPALGEESGIWEYETDTIHARATRQEKDNFVYYAVVIKLTDPAQLATAFSHEVYRGKTEALSDIAERHDPLIAINGDYYSFHNNGVIIRNGELYRDIDTRRALLAVEENGDLTVVTDRTGGQSKEAQDLMARGVRHTFEFGPVLVEDGKAATLQSEVIRVEDDYLEPRTAIGQLGPLHYLVIVVDGRSEGYSAGCNLSTLQQLFLEYGVQTAFNLDGGGSTTLWFDGEVINKPASGDERKVADIVMFMRQ